MLLARYRRRGHVTAVFPRGMQRESSPSGADFEHPVAALEIELAAHMVELPHRSFVKRHVRALEDRARIHHRRIEEQCEELVADVVVRADVAPAAAARVARGGVQHRAHRSRETGPRAIHAVDHVAIAEQDAHQRGQVVAAPVAGNIGLAGPNGSAKSRLDVEAPVADMKRGRERAFRRSTAEGLAAMTVDERQRAVPQPHELCAQDALAPCF
jgi:hypothetical protein